MPKAATRRPRSVKLSSSPLLANKRRVSTTTQRWKAYGYMLVNTLCWSAAFIVVKPAYDVTTPFRFLFYRFLLASVLAIPFVLYYWPKLAKPRWTIMVISVIELIGTTTALAFLYEGLARTNVIEASILTAMTPVFITIGGILLLREKQERHEWLGILVALTATIGLIIQPVVTGLTTFTQLSLVGNLLIFIHAIANLFYFPLAKKYYGEMPKLFVAAISFVVGAFSFGILSLWEAGNLQYWQQMVMIDLNTPSVWLASGYMATFGSIIGLTAYIKGQDFIEASEASFFSYLGLPISLLLATIFLGERLTLFQVGILGLIILGVLIAEKRFPKMSHVFHLKPRDS